MWLFVIFEWPENTKEFKRFYSYNVILTEFDIIFLWVSRMIMFGLYAINEVPFKDVYIHALVLNAKGLKMSKSKGYVIDPLELCAK